MRYVTAQQMREIDRYTIEKEGVSASVLMENAGRAVAEEAMKIIRTGTVAIFAGYGNNGGDGLVTARYIKRRGYNIRVFLVGKNRVFSPETEEHHRKISRLGVVSQKIATINEIEKNLNKFAPDLIVDAIFGIGIRRYLDEFYVKLIGRINAFSVPVVAVDIPSGLDADTGEPCAGEAVKANVTVTFGYPKIGFKNPEAKYYTGKVVVADIGLILPSSFMVQ
ncbi:NAD(P)H-hydrate epimerase [bacterium Unc6]|nr:NAD(P)H-hydrate epimerase [bacterium Unc6]